MTLKKGRARYRAARRRKASPETQSRTDKGLGKMKKEEGEKKKNDGWNEREREPPKLYLLWPEPRFEIFAQGPPFAFLFLCESHCWVATRELQSQSAPTRRKWFAVSDRVSFPVLLFKCRVAGERPVSLSQSSRL